MELCWIILWFVALVYNRIFNNALFVFQVLGGIYLGLYFTFRLLYGLNIKVKIKRIVISVSSLFSIILFLSVFTRGFTQDGSSFAELINESLYTIDSLGDLIPRNLYHLGGIISYLA